MSRTFRDPCLVDQHTSKKQWKVIAHKRLRRFVRQLLHIGEEENFPMDKEILDIQRTCDNQKTNKGKVNVQ